jgi:GT2 family glycosyltransferase
MTVSIVIPNWNGADKLRRNLPKVLKVDGVDEVIVSDDASTDNSLEIIRNEFPQVKLAIRERNGGFSSNVNTGVRVAKGDLVFLLNSDAVPEADCLTKILPHFKDLKVFSVGLNAGGGWTKATFKNGYFWHSQAGSKEIDLSNAHQTLWVSGGSGVFRKSIWEELKGLDELFNPFYEEDTDLGYRATKRGYINLWEPRAHVEHYQEPGVIATHFKKSKVQKTAERNHLIFIWKNITSEKLINEHKRALVKILITHPKYWLTFLPAAKNLPEILKKREIEKKEQKNTDEEILGLI